MKTKRFKKVVEVDPKGLNMTKDIWMLFGAAWIIFIVVLAFKPDSGFPQGRFAAIFFITSLFSTFPFIFSFLLWLSRDVYWEEIK